MFVPQLLKQADNPELKTKIVQLINDKKQQLLDKYFEQYADEYETDEEKQTLGIVLLVKSTKSDLIVQVNLQDKTNGEMVECLEMYRYEDILKAIKNALK